MYRYRIQATTQIGCIVAYTVRLYREVSYKDIYRLVTVTKCDLHKHHSYVMIITYMNHSKDMYMYMISRKF